MIGIYFEWGLFVLLIASVIITLVDRFFCQARRKFELETQANPPFLVDYARSLWPVFLIVFFIRSFIFEPYIVPSGSMLPTIQLGDFIFVNKFAYGIHLPFFGTTLIPTGTPQTGDVAVFKNPVNPQTDLIKTVIGVPGDTISYLNKQLFINGKAVEMNFIQTLAEPNNANLGSIMVQEYMNDLGGHLHQIYTSPAVPAHNFTGLVVPPGEYFCMGDNRDNSDDSRFWGFVSQKQLIGRASTIFLSYNSLTHDIRWNRIGMKMP
ncbi:MAG: signal peptidase I [Gammaproteobacteria bacterium]|nr:signal peptidase I [Gammaproteobacteria bacterium]